MNRSRRWLPATWLLLIGGCYADAPAVPPPPVPSHVDLVSGNEQHADPEDVLGEPVRFRVIDATSRPMAGVVVEFVVPIGGGSVPLPTQTSDSFGIVQTTWTMGALAGAQVLEAHVNGTTMASATATTCDPEECFPPERLSSTLSDATLLNLATYDTSGQTVHPDVVRGHGMAPGFWMAVTPYPGGNALYENPSLYHSRDTQSWEVPFGVTNPLVRPAGSAYLSDPDIVIDTDRKLWLFYRNVANSQNIINVIRSADGVHWDKSTPVVTVPSHMLVSPSVVRRGSSAPWQMWSVNAGGVGCTAPITTIERRTSDDGLNWSAPSTVDLAQPGQAIWHIDVQWISARAEYWALYNTYPAGTSCNTNALYLARSADGAHWTTYPSPVARAGMIPAFQHLIYRSTFMTDPKAKQVTLWISGAEYSSGPGYVWRTAMVSIKVDDLLAIAASPAGALMAAPFRGDLPHPEPDVGRP